MFKGLSLRLRRILSSEANVQARRFNSSELLPEHIVIAILQDEAGTACKALMQLQVDTASLKGFIESSLPLTPSLPVEGEIPPSPRTKRLLEAASEEASILGSLYLGTEHLLCAAMREANSPLQQYLAQRQIHTEVLRSVIQTLFNRSLFNENTFLNLPEYYTIFNRRDEQLSYSGNAAVGKSYHASRVRPASYPLLTPALDEFATDLTALAREGKLDPVIGRKREIQRALRILARRTKNNPVLVGEPGVGKTAIIEGIAQLFVSREVPEALSGKRILSLDIGLIVAGTKYRGEFEERIKRIMHELLQARNIILFIDEIHTIIGAGSAEGTLDVSNLFKPALSRGEVQCIGATTLAEYRRYFEKDAALERRFQSVLVEESSLEDTVLILQGIQKKYEDYHHVAYSAQAVEAAALLAQRYISGKCMPDKAIDVLDEAGAMRRLEPANSPPEVSGLEKEILALMDEKGGVIEDANYDRADELWKKVVDLKVRLEGARMSWEQSARNESLAVGENEVRRVVAEMTGIPLSHLAEQESNKLINIEAELHKGMIGQDDAVKCIASAMRRSRSGISSPNRPLGSFIFLGPTGVGKTLLAKRLSQYLFETPESLVRIDMSDYMEKHNASRLVGAPPGYIGYEEGGLLTERIRRNPYRVILFDEIEKAHHDVFNLLLQVLEEGELKDNLGHTVNFRNTVIIMTSNAGIREISRDSQLGFGNGSGLLSFKEIESSALSELKRFLSPEFLNRVDETVVFHPLQQKQVLAILDLHIEDLEKRLKGEGYAMELSRSARKLLAEKGWNPKYGARPLRRTIQRELEDPLSIKILEGAIPGTIFRIGTKGSAITIKASSHQLD